MWWGGDLSALVFNALTGSTGVTGLSRDSLWVPRVSSARVPGFGCRDRISDLYCNNQYPGLMLWGDFDLQATDADMVRTLHLNFSLSGGTSDYLIFGILIL